MFNVKIHYKWPFSIAMLNYQRVTVLTLHFYGSPGSPLIKHAQITVVPESIHSESNHLRWKIPTIHDDCSWPKHTRTWTRWFQVETSAKFSAFHCISLRSPNCKQKLAVYVYLFIYMNICYIYIYVYIYPDHVVRTYYKTVGIVHKYIYIHMMYIYTYTYTCIYYNIYIVL